MFRSEVAETLSEIETLAGKARRIVPVEVTANTRFYDFEASAIRPLLERLIAKASEVLKEKGV